MAEQKKALKGQELMRSIEGQYLRPNIPTFSTGDTVEVSVRIREGGKDRIQVFSGVCIGRKGGSSRETFTVRRIVQGEGVERIFPLHSPSIESIRLVRRGRARRAKLHYLRQRAGRASRVDEDLRARPGDKKE